MLQVAVQKQKLVRNPCDRVDPPRVPARDMVFLDWDEAVRLAEAHNKRFRALIYLAVDAGMRWGELIGLRRGRVDLSRQKVRVTEQLVHRLAAAPVAPLESYGPRSAVGRGDGARGGGVG
jgi:integrase